MPPELTLEMQLQVLRVENAELKAQLKAINDIINPPPKTSNSNSGAISGNSGSPLDNTPTPLTTKVAPQ